MKENLEAWIDGLLKKGTFANREDIIEFCVGATKTFCEEMGLNQDKIRKEIPFLGFPLRWTDEFEAGLRRKYSKEPHHGVGGDGEIYVSPVHTTKGAQEIILSAIHSQNQVLSRLIELEMTKIRGGIRGAGD